MPDAQTCPFLACIHMHLLRWHKAYLHGSSMPLALGESTSLHLITFNEENCQKGQKQLQPLLLPLPQPLLLPLPRLPDLLLNVRDL